MKIKEFQACMKIKKIDLVILYNTDSVHYDYNIFYFSGYSGLGVLAIPKKSKPFLVVPEMELEKAKKTRLPVYIWKRKTRLFENIKELSIKKRIPCKTLGIDKTSFTLHAYSSFKKYFKKSKTKDISSEISDLKQIKTNKEIAIIKEGCKITDSIINRCTQYIRNKKFRTESEIKAFLEMEANKLDGVSFPPIVASGKNASQPHYNPNNINLNKGFCVIDFGIKYKGYCTDISRTIYIGNPSKKEIWVYGLLLNAQINNIKKIKINDTGNDIYRRVINDLGQYKKYFIHGLGHGIGIKIHELPNVSDGSKDRITENMIFTIEPGIYIPNKLGIRIEDDILMTKKGPVVLTKVPKKLIIIN